jgi:hypothetical protein
MTYKRSNALNATAGSVPQRGNKGASGTFVEPRGFVEGETSLHSALKMHNATASPQDLFLKEGYEDAQISFQTLPAIFAHTRPHPFYRFHIA